MRFRKSTHAVYKTEYHVVWTPRYRRKIFVRGVKQYVEKLLPHIEGLEEDIEVIRVNVQLDHAHLIVVIPPRISVAEVIGYMKSRSSKALMAKFPFLRKAYPGKEGIWSRGYCISCIGMNEKEILAYVEHQFKEDTGQLKLNF
ncbi:MAG: IS200/IS605 family transposase [Elusimicrobiota bacterium]